MWNFTYHNPVRILFGKGRIADLDHEIPSGARVLLTAGGGSIRTNGVYDQVRAALGGRFVVEFWGIEPNPKYETLIRAIEIARGERVDFILAVGGGSVLDGSKFVAAGVPWDAGDPWAMMGDRVPLASALPVGAVLTLPATGSEMNGNAVVSRLSTGEKLAVHNPLLMPRFSVLDPETTYSLPARQVANGIVDAFIHVTEQYLTYPVDSPIQDRQAEAVLLTLVEEARRIRANPNDYDARANIMWAATMALNGLIGVGVPKDFATHDIGHEITALIGLDHARTLAVVLPNLLWEERVEKREKLLQYAARVWGIVEGTDEKRISGAISRTRAFFEEVGVPTHLSAYGATAESVRDIPARLEARGVLPLGERKDLDAAKIARILAAAA